MSKNKRKKHYLPPDKDAVDEYARRVCESVGEDDVADGFAAFINSVARAYTNYLNSSEKGHENE